MTLDSRVLFAGYTDSGADICYVLRENGHHVITESENPFPLQDEGWCFPDTERGILVGLFDELQRQLQSEEPHVHDVAII